MTIRRVLPALLILAMVADGILVAPALPDRVPIHWNLAGEPDGWAGRWVGALGLPTVALAVWGLVDLLERILLQDPADEAVRRTIHHLQLALVVVWVGLYGATLAPPLGHSLSLDPTGVALLALGLFLAATGIVLRRMAEAGAADVLVSLPTDDSALKRDVLRVSGGLLIGGGVVMALGAPFGSGVRLGGLVASLGLQAVGLPVYLVLRAARAG